MSKDNITAAMVTEYRDTHRCSMMDAKAILVLNQKIENAKTVSDLKSILLSLVDRVYPS